VSAASRPTFDAAHLDKRLTALGLSTQEAAEFLRTPPATMAAWRSGKKEPDGSDRIGLRLFMDEGRTHGVKMLIAYQRNRTTLSRAGEGAMHSGVTPPYGTNDVGKRDGTVVPSAPTLPPIRRSTIEPIRDVGPVKS
jgi:hypothetical protein